MAKRIDETDEEYQERLDVRNPSLYLPIPWCKVKKGDKVYLNGNSMDAFMAYGPHTVWDVNHREVKNGMGSIVEVVGERLLERKRETGKPFPVDDGTFTNDPWRRDAANLIDYEQAELRVASIHAMTGLLAAKAEADKQAKKWRPPSPLKVFKFFRGIKVEFYIGLPKSWAMKIASKYMWSKYYRKYINVRNITASIMRDINEARAFGVDRETGRDHEGQALHGKQESHKNGADEGKG